MSSGSPSNGSVDNPPDAHKHTKQESSKHHKHGKQPSAAHDSEAAPLLADGAADEDIEANDVEEPSNEQPILKQEKVRNCYRKGWHWLRTNLMIVAVVCLLLGGIIALLVYFTGTLETECSMLKLLTTSSWLQATGSGFFCHHLSNTSLRPCCLRNSEKHVTKVS